MTKDDMPAKVWAYRTEFGDVRITGNDLLPEKDRLREYVPADLAQPPAVDVEALKQETIKHIETGIGEGMPLGVMDALICYIIDHLHTRGLIGQDLAAVREFLEKVIEMPIELPIHGEIIRDAKALINKRGV